MLGNVLDDTEADARQNQAPGRDQPHAAINMSTTTVNHADPQKNDVHLRAIHRQQGMESWQQAG